MSGEGNSNFSNDYAEKSEFRIKLLIVEGHKFYVNPSFLAEKSEYFKTLFYSDFKEKTMDGIVLKEENARDFGIFLDIIGANPNRLRTLKFSNLSIAAGYADKWQIGWLKDHCCSLASVKGNYAGLCVKDALNVLRVCIELRFGRHAILTAIDYLSRNFSPSKLKKQRIHEIITSSGAVLAIINRFSWRHSFRPSVCSKGGSGSGQVLECLLCGKSFSFKDSRLSECTVICESEEKNVVDENYLIGLI